METPSTVTPTARRGRALDDRDDRPELLERVQDGLGRLRGDDDSQLEGRVGPAARVARDRAAQPRGDVLDQRPCPVDRQPACGSAWLGGKPVEEARLGHRADAAHRAQPAGERSGPQLIGRVHVQRPPDLEHPLRPDAEEAPEADELRLHLPLQLLELGDRAGLHQLGQARGDPGADPAELLHAAGAHELGDGRPRLPHRLGGAAIGARGVALGAGQLEQDGERIEPLGDPCVVDHAGTMPGRGCTRLCGGSPKAPWPG